jgi:hypothetical protein
MLILLFVISLFAATGQSLPVIEKGEERERLKLEEILLVEHRAGLGSMVVVASSEKQAVEYKFAQERDLKSVVTAPSSPLGSGIVIPEIAKGYEDIYTAPSSPLGSGIVIPEIAKGYEDIYLRFINGRLSYRPVSGNNVGKIDLLIAELSNPLAGIFDLSRCGKTGQYLSIATGYKNGTIPENVNKIEVWLAPRFLIESGIFTSAAHFRAIMEEWQPTAPIGIFWTWGSHAVAANNFDYVTNQSIDKISNNNLFEKWSAANQSPGAWARLGEMYHFRFCL